MDRLDRVLEELMELKAEQARQGVRLDTYNEQLKEHMRNRSRSKSTAPTNRVF